jgi:copper(I)-binding protein
MNARMNASMNPTAAVRLVLTLALAVVAASGVLGCTARSAPGAGSASLKIEDAFARPAPSGGNGGAFLTVVNAGPAADRLVAARSPVAPTIEFHETIDDNGIMKMRAAPGGFDVPANGRLELKPGGRHVMFIGLTAPLVEGEEVELTLVFEKAGQITVKAPIRM